ncbi:hypothetical protein HXX76_001278 [Chlamydomonas incerta]|uniref:Uncharacterized protein n=1 Tax=Chlamydomonas incerta TaxID=51695 RepID=A0A836B193_CHLIN|nr:hypothetical protein HXX76_001278 [Chlamydomonas incerta]|eukprot:KAG2444532.1 hypothetical protein HXX76_001278 [Chlamydomonas incerta]
MKRKHAAVGALGLGGYASDEDEGEVGSQEAEDAADDQSQGEQSQGVLLPHYRSKESLDADELEALGEDGEDQDEDRRRSPLTAGTSSGDGDADGRPRGGPAPANPLSRLPPELRDPLPTECSDALQAKFSQYVATLRGRGISLTDSIMQRKAFRNPDFLQKLVEHFNIKELGSAFPPDVFQPDELPAEDTIEALLRALEREQERRARAREAQVVAGTARIDFSKGAGALGHIPASNSASNLLMAQQAAAVAAAAVARVVGKR